MAVGFVFVMRSDQHPVLQGDAHFHRRRAESPCRTVPCDVGVFAYLCPRSQPECKKNAESNEDGFHNAPVANEIVHGTVRPAGVWRSESILFLTLAAKAKETIRDDNQKYQSILNPSLFDSNFNVVQIHRRALLAYSVERRGAGIFIQSTQLFIRRE